MSQRTFTKWIYFLTCVLFLVGGATSWASSEQALWGLWNRHLADTSQHEVHVTAFEHFAYAYPNDSLTPVARTIAAWHLLKLGKVDEARVHLEAFVEASDTDTAQGAGELAKAWLSRLDREKVVQALSAYRVEEVRYPETLAALQDHPRIVGKVMYPETDRWGQPWGYRQDRLRSLPGLVGQRYVLQSRTLRDTSELAAALEMGYAEQLSHQPLRIFQSSNRPPVVQLAKHEQAGDPVIATQGSWVDGVRIAYVSSNLVILHDRLHWKVMRAPTP